jgi:hypothetical protein
MPIGIDDSDDEATPADDSDDEDEDSDDETAPKAEAKAKPAEDSEIDSYYEAEEEDLKGWGDEVVKETASTRSEDGLFDCALDQAARSCNSRSGGKSGYGKGKDKGYKTSKGKGKGKTLQELERKLEEQVEKIQKLEQKTDWQGEKIQELLQKTDWMYPVIMRHKELIATQRHELDWWHKHGKWQ